MDDLVPEHLSPCPAWTLSCVCSLEGTFWFYRVKPFAVSGDPLKTFARLENLIAKTARTVIVTATETYLHAVYRTKRGYLDDLECRLCPMGRVIHVRSASRRGIYDFGVNRRRVERLRRQLSSTDHGEGGPRLTGFFESP